MASGLETRPNARASARRSVRPLTGSTRSSSAGCTRCERPPFTEDPLDAWSFRRWPDASGQWISESVVQPVGVGQFGDLLKRHAEAAIELRVVPSLWPIRDLAVSDRWDYSLVRMSKAQPRA